MAVVDSGRRTSSGRTIWKSAPKRSTTRRKSSSSKGSSSSGSKTRKQLEAEQKEKLLKGIAKQDTTAGRKLSSSRTVAGRRLTPEQTKQLVAEEERTKRTLSLSGRTKGGGTITVSRTGLVTERDRRGRLIRQFQADPNQAQQIIQQQAPQIERSIKAQRQAKVTEQKFRKDVALAEKRKQIVVLTGGFPVGSESARGFMKLPFEQRQRLVSQAQLRNQLAPIQQFTRPAPPVIVPSRETFVSRSLSKLSDIPEVREKGAVTVLEEKFAKEKPFESRSFLDIFRKEPDKPFLLEPEAVGIGRGALMFATRRPLITSALPLIGFGIGGTTTLLTGIGAKTAIAVKTAEIGLGLAGLGSTAFKLATVPGETSIERRIKRGEIIGETGVIVAGLTPGIIAGKEKAVQFLATRSLGVGKIAKIRLGSGKTLETGKQLTEFTIGGKRFRALTKLKTIRVPKQTTPTVVRTPSGKLEVILSKPSSQLISRGEIRISPLGKRGIPGKPNKFIFEVAGITSKKGGRLEFALTKPGIRSRLFEAGEIFLKTKKVGEGNMFQTLSIEKLITPKGFPRAGVFVTKPLGTLPFPVTKTIGGIHVSATLPSERFIVTAGRVTADRSASALAKLFLSKKGSLFLVPPKLILPPPIHVSGVPTSPLTFLASKSAITSFIRTKGVGIAPLILPFAEGLIGIPKKVTSSIPKVGPDIDIKSIPDIDIRSIPDIDIKLDIKLEPDLDVKLLPDVKVKTGTKLIREIIPEEIVPPLPVIIPSTPTIIPRGPRFPKLLLFPELELELKGNKQKTKRKKALKGEILSLLPDFTSRIIGLKPQVFKNVNQAIKEMQRIKTGFEIRRGGVIMSGKTPQRKRERVMSLKQILKGSNMDNNFAKGFSEKDLLKDFSPLKRVKKKLKTKRKKEKDLFGFPSIKTDFSNLLKGSQGSSGINQILKKIRKMKIAY